jgi:hypothetical protein
MMGNKKVRSVLLASISLLALGGLAAVPQATEDDPYSIAVVQALLKQPPGFSSGVTEKQSNRLGDKAAIAFLKIHNEEGLSDPSQVRTLLPLVRAAFAYPKLISIPSDQQPRITVVFLRYLLTQVKDPSIRHQIRDTLAFVQAQTAVPPSPGQSGR